jgi:Na+/H+ antiporter NhaD/arsenite permease-like protein
MPSPAVLSLIALLLVVAASLTSRLNVGVLAVALATPVAIVGAGWKPEQIMATFPSSLFLTLTGVTLFFGVLQANGTMQTVTHRSVRLLRGNVALLPLLLFALACVISSLGPGSIATAALLAPLAMGIAHRAGVPLLLAALMIGNGVNAGNLSAISAIGVLVQELMTKAGLGGHAWETWSANFAAHALAAAIAWALFGGPRLVRAGRPASVPTTEATTAPPATAETADGTRTHALSLLVLGLWMTAVVAFKVNPGLAGFAAASVLVLTGLGEDAAMLRQVPWAVLVMVCGVSVLIGVLEKTGGMELFTTLLSRLATPDTVNGVIAGVTGLISTYSSTAGVVYPAFLPAVPGLVAKLGGGNPLEIALSINVGAALVDVSPLSTIGSLCIAAVPAGVDSKPLFRALLLWGFAMTLVAALFCQLFIGLFAG